MRISDWSSDVCSSDLQLPDMLEDPPHARAASGRITRDDELLGRVRAAFAVDPQALLDLQRAFGGAELPERPAAPAQQRAQLVGGQARRNITSEVKGHSETLFALAPRPGVGEPQDRTAQDARR